MTLIQIKSNITVSREIGFKFAKYMPFMELRDIRSHQIL